MLLTKQGTFTKTFRAVGFAQMVYVLAPLALIPSVGSSIRILILLLGFVATWLAAAEAHETSGWKTVFFPVAAYGILFVGFIIIGVLLAGLDFALESVMVSLGIQAP